MGAGAGLADCDPTVEVDQCEIGGAESTVDGSPNEQHAGLGGVGFGHKSEVGERLDGHSRSRAQLGPLEPNLKVAGGQLDPGVKGSEASY
jgi:hypothetical protein